MKRREFFGSLTGAAALAAQRPKPRRPNFLVILADDMGYSDAGCYGGGIDTPNIDSLASGGLRFTQGYSTARCGPSRACMLTGQYAQQTACDVMTAGNVPAWTRFAPQHLKPLGYRAYHSGKWHIRFHPLATVGFDRSYTLIDQLNHFTTSAHLLDDQPLPRPKPEDRFYGTQAIAGHAVDFLQSHARAHKEDPFYFYLAFTAPHFPLHALQEDIAGYKDRFAEGWDVMRERHHRRMREMGLVNCRLAKMEPGMYPQWNLTAEEQLARFGPGEVARAVPWATLTREQKDFQRTKMAIHAAMITRMDREIGRVLAQLRAMNAFDDTLILFLSDNGASAEIMIRGEGHDPKAAPGSERTHLCLGPAWATASNTPFRLHKSWVHEGGIASPWIAHWPAGIAGRGQLRHAPCHFVDVVPTMIDLGGGKPSQAAAPGAPPLAGQSIAPAFRKDTLPRELLYFNHNNNRAIRQGDWKLVAAGKSGPWELYNLANDRCEQNNLIANESKRAGAMASLWQRTDTGFAETREAAPPAPWPRLGRRGQAGEETKRGQRTRTTL
ncbi:MAG: sulfatase-like hydrolase/transferase [Bryobacterales bacterium]|nr:sulfatase-like hydrolase/transferase [Bryobacterales bacterium]